MSQNTNLSIKIEDIKVEPIEEPEEQISNFKIEIEIEPNDAAKGIETEEVNTIDKLKSETDLCKKQRKITEIDYKSCLEITKDVGYNDSKTYADVNGKDEVKNYKDEKQILIEVEIKQEPVEKYSDPLPEIKDTGKLYYHPQCQIISPTTSNTHQATHTCDMCHRNFQTKRSLNAHKKIHNFMCDNCGQYFKHKHDLITHLQNHSSKDTSQQCDKRQFKCDTCHKVFVTRSGLNKHSKLHSGNLFTCDICDKQFTEKGNLVCHKRIHTGEKPFQCPVCKRDFTQKSSLNSHIRNHSETKPFACRICRKEFCKKRNLIIHEYIHSDVKPFKCDICDKQFSQVSVICNVPCYILSVVCVTIITDIIR